MKNIRISLSCVPTYGILKTWAGSYRTQNSTFFIAVLENGHLPSFDIGSGNQSATKTALIPGCSLWTGSES